MTNIDYIPRVNGVLGLTYQESVDYFGIEVGSQLSRSLPHAPTDETTPVNLVEIAGGHMKRSPYHGE